MLEWYKTYDRETFMKDFSTLEFRKFSPFHKSDQGQLNDDEESLGVNSFSTIRGGQDAPPAASRGKKVQSVFDDYNAFG